MVNFLLALFEANDYSSDMRFAWDEHKNRINVHRHGYSFADAHAVFGGPMLVALDERDDYGEQRWVGIGRLRAQVVVVVYTEPGEDLVRIISLRKALRHERSAYEQLFRD